MLVVAVDAARTAGISDDDKLGCIGDDAVRAYYGRSQEMNKALAVIKDAEALSERNKALAARAAIRDAEALSERRPDIFADSVKRGVALT